MRLLRLTGLERDKIEDEYQNLVTLIADLKEMLANEYRGHGIIRDELSLIHISGLFNQSW